MKKGQPILIHQTTIHNSSNWRQLWSECQSTDPPKRLYICKASYYMTGENIRLSRVWRHFCHQSSTLQLMCCALQLDVTLDWSRMSTSQLDWWTVQLVLWWRWSMAMRIVLHSITLCRTSREHPPPYCIAVDCPGFRGFCTATGERILPFPNQPHWVPMYRETEKSLLPVLHKVIWFPST